MNNIKIYGAIGYTILYDSPLFPNTEILIISDNHDEYIKECNSKQITIDEFLKQYLINGYKIFLEEIPSKNELVEIFPSSTHIKRLRKLYLDNMDKIIATDIRLDLIDITLLNDSKLPLIFHYIKLFEFFMIKSKLFDLPIIKKYYLILLKRFTNFIKHYKDYIIKKSIDINNIILNNIIEDTSILLIDIMDFYTFSRIYTELTEKRNNKLIINCGLYHSENLIKHLIKHLNYKIKKQSGINKISESNYIDNMCIDYFQF